jgi:hypothetical protein
LAPEASTATQPLNRNNVDAKVNWNRNERQQIWFKYSAMNALVTGDFGLGDAGGECNCGGGVGTGGAAGGGRDGQCLELVVADIRCNDRHIRDQQLDVVAEQIGDRATLDQEPFFSIDDHGHGSFR